MKKFITISLTMIPIFIWSYVFSYNNAIYSPFQPILSIPWVYNPISWFYEPKTQEEIEKEIVNSMDFYTDTSLQKFLDDKHSLSWNYEANDIVRINSDFTTNKSSDFMLRKEAAEMFEWMARVFSNAFDFKAKLTINSARRSQAFQRKLASTCSNVRCAKPWTSEHEAWLALDLWVNGVNIMAWSGKYYQRLMNNAHLYGFHNSYQKWVEVDGKMSEPRHRRYVWVQLATLLHEKWQTFTEYFYDNIEINK